MSKKRWIHDRYGSKLSPVFADNSDEEDEMSLDDYRRTCDLCNEPRKPGKPKLYGGLVTFVNADKIVDLRYLSELALKLFIDVKSNSFKLLKVCKINHGGCGYYGLTFRAQEDGIKHSLVFRGVVHAAYGKKEALFCEIKDDDDEITLLSCDDDYVSSERACESEDCPPRKRYLFVAAKNDL
ncbi:uncharacterized protein LOC142529861 isoform X1 [Primulina tabacum]|uniref:uncharacterized protein LOC142529861 isoform X1 n=1 Tax=Primulina tabacum TaxID=48773 RepID=UPI003F59D93B